jgi:CDP-diacylglycerol pyrophosphatase
MQVQADPVRSAAALPRSGAGTWRATLAAAALLLASCAGQAPSLPPPPAHPHGQALWRIIHDQCVPDQRANGDPAPCELVSMPDGEARGYVILKDRTGVAQYLVMPTAKITGIEDPALLAPGATNYFARAWGARRFVEARLGHTLDRSQISVAVNSPYGRSQDQLHLHVDCLDGYVGAALRTADIPQNGRWTRIDLKGHAYRVRWLKDEQTLEAVNPFKLLAKSIPGGGRAMGAWSLALVGARTADGVAGFYLLADRADPASGDRGSAEELQDHACRM